MSTEPGGIGVVVVSYNTRDLLDQCLISLSAELGDVQHPSTVWVVDNGSHDGSVDMVRRNHPHVRVLEMADNLGFAAANNAVLEPWAADAGAAPNWVLVLNPDTEVHPGAIGELIGALAAEPRAAVAGPRLVFPDGRFQHGAFRFPGLAQTVLDVFPINRLAESSINGRYSRALYDGGRPFEVDFPLGACMLVRGPALAEVGAMDAGFFMYCEEIDWCRRFRAAGYSALCVPSAVVVHHAGASTGQFRGAMLAQLWRSRLRYFRKHEPPLRRWLLESTVVCGLRARRILDRVETGLGRMSADERAARAAAYDAALSSDPR